MACVSFDADAPGEVREREPPEDLALDLRRFEEERDERRPPFRGERRPPFESGVDGRAIMGPAEGAMDAAVVAWLGCRPDRVESAGHHCGEQTHAAAIQQSNT